MALTADFEQGVLGANVATTDPGSVSKWDATIFGGTIVYDNAHVAHGALSMKANNKSIGWTSGSVGSAVTDHYGRLYIWTSDSGQFCRMLSGGINGSQAATLDLSVNGFIVSSAAAGGNLVGTHDLRNQMIRVEWHFVHSATVGQAIINTYLGDGTVAIDNIVSAANRNMLASIDTIRFGSSSASLTYWIDDVVAIADAFPGPATVPPIYDLVPVSVSAQLGG